MIIEAVIMTSLTLILIFLASLMIAGSGTLISGYSNQIYAGGAKKWTLPFQVDGADVFPGCTLSGDGLTTTTHRDLGTAISHATTYATGTPFAGVCDNRIDLDIDTIIANNVDAEFFPPRSGQIVWCRLDTSGGAVEPGMDIIVSATAGQVRLSPYTTATTPDAAELKVATDQLALALLKGHVGIALDYSADVAAVRWIRVMLG